MCLLSKATRPTLYHCQYWSSSRPAAVLLELGVSNVDIVKVTEGQIKSDPLLAELNPQKRLPFFFDPELDLKLNESGGMVEYLLETYDTDGKLAVKGEDAKLRAEYFKLLHFGPATMYHIGVPIFGHSMGFAPLSEKEVKTKTDDWKRIVIPTIEYALDSFGGPFLLGEKFTAVDAVCGYDLMTISFTKYVDELLHSSPKIKTYMEIISNRKVYKDLYTFDDAKEEVKE